MNLLWDFIDHWNNMLGLIVTAIALASMIYTCYWGLARKLQSIYKELIPNGGKSLHDKILRLESLFKASLRINGKPFMVYSKDGELIDISDDFYGITGRSPSQLLGMGFINSIEEDDVLEFMEHFKMCISNRIEFDHTYNIVRSDGLKIKVRNRIVPMFVHKTQAQELVGFLGWLELLPV